MDDLIAFLAARLAEAWSAARDRELAAGLDESAGTRMIDAFRAILDRHMPHETAFGGPACDWCSEDVDDRPQLAKERWPCPDVLSLAAVWSGHPDYRQEWEALASPS